MPPRARPSTVLAGLVNWLLVPAACLLSMIAMFLAPEAVDTAVREYHFGLLAGTLRVAGRAIGAWLRRY